MRTLLLILVLLAGLLLLRLSVFTVDCTEFVYLTQFGRPVATYDGADPAEAGLHFRWPWPIQSAQALDRRLQYFDLPGAELLTRDPQRKTIDRTLTIDAYVCWRIADKAGADRFLRAVATPDRARSYLGQRISSELGAAISRLELDDLINTSEGKVERTQQALKQRLLDEVDPGSGSTQSLRDMARSEYGIEVVDIRLRRFNYPPAVRQAIFDRIISEREKKAAEYESEGKRLASEISSTSDRKVAELDAEAKAEAVRLRGQAERQADQIRNETMSRDPQFYAFLKKLEDYQRFLGDNKTLLLLSTHRELFDALFNPPAVSPPARNTGEGKSMPPKTTGGQ
jgi:membrane protease subunit HflC